MRIMVVCGAGRFEHLRRPSHPPGRGRPGASRCARRPRANPSSSRRSPTRTCSSSAPISAIASHAAARARGCGIRADRDPPRGRGRRVRRRGSPRPGPRVRWGHDHEPARPARRGSHRDGPRAMVSEGTDASDGDRNHGGTHSSNRIDPRPARTAGQALHPGRCRIGGSRSPSASPAAKPVNAASILAVIAQGIDHGDEVTLVVDGGDEQAVLDQLVELLTPTTTIARGIGRPSQPTGRASDGDQGHRASARASRSDRSCGWPIRCRSRWTDPSHLDRRARGRARAGHRCRWSRPSSRSRGAKAGGAAQDVLEAQAMMAEDPSLIDEITDAARAGKTAERAVFEAFAAFRDLLAGMGGYMGERAADLDDISQRVIAHLLRLPAPGRPRPGASVRAGRPRPRPGRHGHARPRPGARPRHRRGRPDLAHRDPRPREVDRRHRRCGAMPRALADGTRCIVDAANGVVVSTPTPDEIDGRQGPDRRACRARGGARDARARSPTAPRCRCSPTSARPTAPREAAAAGAEGVGLFRTEFLFLDADTAPSVAEQQAAVHAAARRRSPGTRSSSACSTRAPTSRCRSSTTPHEENPALGLRGIRALRHSELILREQLTALAAADGGDRRRTLGHGADGRDRRGDAVLHRAREGARHPRRRRHGRDAFGGARGRPRAGRLRLRVDRHERPDPVHDGRRPPARHRREPAEPVAPRRAPPRRRRRQAGAALGKPVGICGEAAADPLLAVVLVGLGVTSLSMSPSALADVRASLARYSPADAKALAEAALAAEGAAEARAAAQAVASDITTARASRVVITREASR